MKKNYLILILTVLFAGCNVWGVRGNGDLEVESRNIDEFEYVDISGAFDVLITVGEETSLIIETDDNLLQYIKTHVSGDVLHISSKKNLSPKSGLKIVLTTPKLYGMDISGANSIYADGFTEGKLYVDASGACDVELKGLIEKLKVDMSGACSFDSKDLLAEKVIADLSGASSAKVYASKSISADCSGASSISYYGDPESVVADESGASSISKR